MAGALAVFKANMIDAQRLRDEQLANEERQAEQRKELVKLADGFESVIGEIVETVTVSSGDLERSASSLSATAARSGADHNCHRGFRRCLEQRPNGGSRDR